MITHHLLLLFGLATEADGMPMGWFERFGFAAGLVLLILFGLYRLSRLAINKVGDEIRDWLRENNIFMKELRRAIPSAERKLEDRTEAMELMGEGIQAINASQATIAKNTQELLALTRARKGESK